MNVLFLNAYSLRDPDVRNSRTVLCVCNIEVLIVDNINDLNWLLYSVNIW